MRTYVLGVLLASIFLFTGCATLTSFEEGRTLGKDMMECRISANHGRGVEIRPDSTMRHYSHGNFTTKIGLTDRSDFGVRFDASTTLSLFYKYQVLGTKSSFFASSVLGEAGISGAAFAFEKAFIYFFRTGLRNSFYLGEHFAVTISPRAMYANETIDGLASSRDETRIYDKWHFGATYGISYGKRNKVQLEVVQLDWDKQVISRIGLGFSFIFDPTKKRVDKEERLY